MKRFGEKLRMLRRRNRFTQSELGERLGVVQSHIAGMERGETQPSVEILLKLTKIFHISADILINDELELDDTL
jgi:transcriptional regulator with XRE-family HTH domain